MNPRRRYALVAVGLVGGLLLVMALLSLVVAAVASSSADETTQEIRKAQKANSEVLRLVKSCTSPGQKCFERGQRQTRSAVSDINKVSILAAACADKPDVQTADDIYACVVRKLAAGTRATP